MLGLVLIVIGFTVFEERDNSPLADIGGLDERDNSPTIYTGGLVERDNAYEYDFVEQLTTDTHTINHQEGVDFAQLGKLTGEFFERRTKNEAFVIYGETIVISKIELEFYTRRLELFGFANAYEDAREWLARGAVLYAEAVSLGYATSDAEVQAQIDLEISSFQKSINFDEISTYFESTQLTVEEYFQSLFEQRRREIIVSNFLESRIENFGQATVIEEDADGNIIRISHDNKPIDTLVDSLKEKYEIIFR